MNEDPGLFANKPNDSAHPENIRYRAGTGNWAAFAQSEYTIEDVFLAASGWKSKLAGIDKPWLCWSVDPEWCLVQQRLVRSVGWTPVVGFDPRTKVPQLEAGAVLIDFNAEFGFPTMWFHFPLEFAFLFSRRLAFWHADLLVRPEALERYSKIFENLDDGSIAAVRPAGRIKRFFDKQYHRYWELLGCTTNGASSDQFRTGSGWWMNFAQHPNAKAANFRNPVRRPYWDSGAGIWHWERRCKGRVFAIPEAEISEGHFTSINNKNYIHGGDTKWRRNLGSELSQNYELREACKSLDLTSFL